MKTSNFDWQVLTENVVGTDLKVNGIIIKHGTDMIMHTFVLIASRMAVSWHTRLKTEQHGHLHLSCSSKSQQ